MKYAKHMTWYKEFTLTSHENYKTESHDKTETEVAQRYVCELARCIMREVIHVFFFSNDNVVCFGFFSEMAFLKQGSTVARIKQTKNRNKAAK